VPARRLICGRGLGTLPDRGAAVTVTNMDWLADDLLLLAVRGNGTRAAREKLRFGVAAAELVQLAARGSVDISDGQITILDSSSTGDPLLDDALASMTTRATVPSAKMWVGLNRPGLAGRHLAALMAAGTIREGQRKTLGLSPGYAPGGHRSRAAGAGPGPA
jgi:Golgi phosphoprotein 3 (GPP34)